MLPLGYTEVIDSDYIQVGCIYSVDSNGKPFIGRFNVSNTSEGLDHTFDKFVAYLVRSAKIIQHDCRIRSSMAVVSASAPE